MIVTGSLPLHRGNRKRGKVFGSLSTMLLMFPVVLLFFLAGLYAGTLVVHQHTYPDTRPGRNALRTEGKQDMNQGPDQLPNAKHAPLDVVINQPPPETHEKPRGRVNPSDSHLDDEVSAGHPQQLQPPDVHDEHEELKLPSSQSTNKAVAPLPSSFDLNRVYDDIIKGFEYSLQIRTGAYMQGSSSYDAGAVLLSAWIYMSSKDKSASMKTILSNKLPGCETSADRHGFSIYVNGWETSDQNLYVEWGSDTSGCQKLSSSPARIEYDRWYHVALALGDHSIALYINGVQVALKDYVSRGQQTGNQLQIGRHPLGQYPFLGNISHVIIVKTEDMPGAEIVQKALDVRTADEELKSSLWAHFPLHDAAAETPDSKAQNTAGSPGTYHFPFVTKGAKGPTGLVDGVGKRTVTESMIQESDDLGRRRREKVKGAMQHAWAGYEKYAWGKDELKPISKRGHDNWGGMGVTLVDSLDTLWLMGMKEEFSRAREWVAKSLTFDHAGTVSTFETTIRELGGLLSAYDLSGDKDKAKELGNRLLPAFNTPSGIAKGQVNLNSGNAVNAGWAGGSSILAELGTLQIEFCYLGEAVGDRQYCDKAMKAFEILYERRPEHGLYPIHVNPGSGQFNNRQVTFGALGDSFYEYMLKLWLQGSKTDPRWREMYDRAMDGVANKLLQKSDPSGLAYVADWDGGRINHKMDHLVCFLPGILALGAYTDPNGLESERAQRDLAMAKALTYTCYQMYARQQTGIAPEYVNFVAGRDMQAGPGAGFYILRPETAESLFVLHQLTKDPIYREWGFQIFEAIEQRCKTEVAYGALPNVQHVDGRVDDRMESFFLAETLKYLFLLQDPDHPIDLMKYVFNTEAHPMQVFKRA